MFPTGPLIFSEESHEAEILDTDDDSLQAEAYDELKLAGLHLAKKYIKFLAPSSLSLAKKVLKKGAVAMLANPTHLVQVGPITMTAKDATEKIVSFACAASIIIPRYCSADDKKLFVKQVIIELTKDPLVSVSYNKFVHKLSHICGSSECLSLYPEAIKSNEYMYDATQYLWHKHTKAVFGGLFECGKRLIRL